MRMSAVLAGFLCLAACGREKDSPAPVRKTAVPVVATGAAETSPAAGPGLLAWTRGSTDGIPAIQMKLGVVLVRRASGRPVAVTPPHVLAASGGTDGRRLVVEVVRSGQSDLELVDLADRSRRSLPAAVNTREWEWRGSISGPWLLFGRYRAPVTYQIVVYNLVTRELRILDEAGVHAAYAEPGLLDGRYAVWAACHEGSCAVSRYDLKTRKGLRITTDYEHTLYAPSVTAAGDVYYARGGRGCGNEVELLRYRQRTGSRVVYTFAPGHDLRFTATTR